METLVTAIGTPNIAFVKYWGKRDSKRNLPMNSSVSMTLDETLNTKTSVLFSDRFKDDRVYINGKISHSGKGKADSITAMLDYMRGLARIEKKALVVSENSFPTSAGLASSASGAATLAFAVSNALDLRISRRDLSIIARQISGSGCRSLFGGFVLWRRGEKANGTDSYAEMIEDENHWPEVIDIITMVSGEKKKVTTTAGHELTSKTSQLYRIRPEIAERNVKGVVAALHNRSFGTLAEMIMRDSNSMHAVMLDTWPPIIYLMDKSRDVINAIHELNKNEGKAIAAYTFDAGPNAQLITLKRYKNTVIDAVKDIVGKENVIVVGQGKGPRMLTENESLIDHDSLKPLIR